MSLHRSACCCQTISCPEFAECAPALVTFPKIQFNRVQEVRWPIGTGHQLRTEIAVTITDLELQYDSGSGCYVMTENPAQVEISFTSSVYDVLHGTVNVAVSGCVCPPCLQTCLWERWTFTANDTVTTGITLCCVTPCGPSNAPVLMMEANINVDGVYDYEARDTSATNCGTCKPVVRPLGYPDPGPYPLAFRAYTNLTCDESTWFKCRTVDFYWGDSMGSNFFFTGRISPADTCHEYQFEKPYCEYDGESPTRTVFNCLKGPYGAMLTHFDTCSCDLPPLYYPTECIDTSKPPCESFIKCCSNRPALPCDPITPPYCPTGFPDPCCNSDGVIPWRRQCDFLASLWEQPV